MFFGYFVLYFQHLDCFSVVMFLFSLFRVCGLFSYAFPFKVTQKENYLKSEVTNPLEVEAFTISIPEHCVRDMHETLTSSLLSELYHRVCCVDNLLKLFDGERSIKFVTSAVLSLVTWPVFHFSFYQHLIKVDGYSKLIV